MSADPSTVDELMETLDQERVARTAALGFALLPCPFCSGAPYVDHNDDFDVDFINCDCGASYSGDDLSAWNSRALTSTARH